MRTSRVSRDTARAVSVLSSPSGGNPGLRRSLRRFGNGPESQDVGTIDSDGEAQENGDENIETTLEPSNNQRLGKRKRGTKAALTNEEPKLSADAAAVSSRRSPRKAPKLEAGQDANTTGGPRKAKRQPAKHVKGPNGNIKVEPPLNWEEVYDITAEMRKHVLAPVDTMGCESLADETRSPIDQRLQTLVALMLSSQTKDTVTAVAMKNLQDNLPGSFCLQSLIDVEPEELNRLIEKVGFHNNKTKYIKQTALILRDKFNGDIPDTIEGLVSLPGVGPKMAYLTMSAAWGRDEGIGVDVHVHRITNLWGWHKTSTPEQTRAELEAWLPKDKWHSINHLLVGFGQTICLPVGRKCGDCELSVRKLCPSAVASSPVKRKVKKEVGVKVDDGNVVKAENVKVEEDDVSVKVEAELEDAGTIELQATSGASIPDIEGAGAGSPQTKDSETANVE